MGSKYTVEGTTGNITTAGSITSTSTTSGFLLPKVTTTQRDAIPTPATGLEVFNTTTNQVEFYNGTVWGAVGGSGSGTITNLLINGGFESWPRGGGGSGQFSSTGQETSTSWYIGTITGAQGSGQVVLAPPLVNANTGLYDLSWGFNNPGTGTVEIYSDVPNYTEFAGQTVTLSVKCAPYEIGAGGSVFVMLDDGVTTTSSSSLTSSSSSYSTLVVTKTLSSSLSRLRVVLRHINGNPLTLAYWDSAMLVTGSSAATYTPSIYPVKTVDIEYQAISQFQQSVTGGSTDLTTITTKSITTTGGPVYIFGTALFSGISAGGPPAGIGYGARVTRGGVSIPGAYDQSEILGLTAGVAGQLTAHVIAVDTPVAGTYTYNFTYSNNGTFSPMSVTSFDLILLELKR